MEQDTLTTILALAGWASLIAGTIAGMIKRKNAGPVKKFFLGIAHLIGNNTPKDKGGTSIPFLPIDIGAEDVVDEPQA